MKPWDHQVEIGKQVACLLKKHALAYLAMEERTGKSLTAILAIEQLNVKNVLIVTKKVALKGWEETFEAYPRTKIYQLTNYHQAHKVRTKPDLVILDEAHNYISGFPKPSSMWSKIRRLTKDVPILYLSATPCSQGYAMLYHQLKLSSWSPWRTYSTFYNWHKAYGHAYTKWINSREVDMYDQIEDEPVVWSCVEHLFIFKTRKELGFEHEPVDKVHWIELSDATVYVYNHIVKEKVFTFKGDHMLVADSVSKLRYSLHMLEGGGIKIEDNYIVLANNEKIQYILDTWGDTKDLVIMYHFKVEKIKLEAAFKNASILQGTSNAEGVDLKDYRHLVIYSQDYSTARHSQRRARQANLKRNEPIIVHFLLVKKAISAAVYETVSVNKANYIDSLYEGVLI